MDVKKYIESGILDEYVFGTLSQEEMVEVYDNSMLYPEIQEAINAIDEVVVPKLTIPAPRALLDQIMSDLPGVGDEGDIPAEEKGRRRGGVPPWLFGVVVLGMLGGLFFLWTDREELGEELVEANGEIDSLRVVIASLQLVNVELSDSVRRCNNVVGPILEGNTAVLELIAEKGSALEHIKDGATLIQVSLNYTGTKQVALSLFLDPNNRDLIQNGTYTNQSKGIGGDGPNGLFVWGVKEDTVGKLTPILIGELNLDGQEQNLGQQLNRICASMTRNESLIIGISIEPTGSTPTKPTMDTVKQSDVLKICS